MPRLSIIVPHRKDDAALENTVLSVLENKPFDSEIIVVHDGSYSDPYELDDELVFVEENGASDVQLLNAGIQASLSPIICLLCNGTTVNDQLWSEAAIRQFSEDRRLAAVAVASRAPNATSFGIRIDSQLNEPLFSRSQVESTQSARITAPSLNCGFYRRKVLDTLGGWNDELAWETVDVEMAMLFQENKLRCGCVADSASTVCMPVGPVDSVSCVKQMAELSAAYGLRHSGAIAAGLDLLRGLLRCKPRRALAWTGGLRSVAELPNLRRRRHIAMNGLSELLETIPQSDLATIAHRRAA